MTRSSRAPRYLKKSFYLYVHGPSNILLLNFLERIYNKKFHKSRLANYVRKVCALQNPPNMTIEIGKITTKVFIDRNRTGFEAYCHETKGSFTCAVEDRTAATLIPTIREYIHPATIIMSDPWMLMNAHRGIGNIPVSTAVGNNTYNFESTCHSCKQRYNVRLARI